MVISGVPPPMVVALRRVRRHLSGTPLWMCCAGRAGNADTPSGAAPEVTSGGQVAVRASLALPNQILKPTGCFAETLSIRPRSGSHPAIENAA
jgi:hypothetical protein